MSEMTRLAPPAGPKVGDLVTPTGRLVVGHEDLHSEAWLAARRWRGHTIGPWSLNYCVGSSDVPNILDLDGVDTPARVYREKVYGIEKEVNENMRWGNIFEHDIALEWCRRNHVVIDEIGLIARDEMPWRQSTIDRRVRECPVHKEAGVECGLEVKHVEFVSAARWHTANGLPDRITAQIVDQLLNTGYDHMHYACKVPGDFKQGIVYRRDEQKLMAYVDKHVEAFRRDYLIRGVEPAWNLDKPEKMIALDNDTHPEREGVAELDIKGIGEVMAYAEIASDAGAIDKAKKRQAAALRQLADGAEIATFAGERVFWYGEGHRSNTDLEKLKEEWPDAYRACVTENAFPVLHIDKAYKPRGTK
jgi:predicted phage-related endonuclease